MVSVRLSNVRGRRQTDDVYPYGVDPVWVGKSNELRFYNSLKMKLAVSLGVIHMLFGIILSAFNHIHFKNRLALMSVADQARRG
jgi:V-type H+-transporting ATPase subunit a